MWALAVVAAMSIVIGCVERVPIDSPQLAFASPKISGENRSGAGAHEIKELGLAFTENVIPTYLPADRERLPYHEQFHQFRVHRDYEHPIVGSLGRNLWNSGRQVSRLPALLPEKTVDNRVNGIFFAGDWPVFLKAGQQCIAPVVIVYFASIAVR